MSKEKAEKSSTTTANASTTTANAQKEKALLVPVRAINSGHVLVQKNHRKEKVKVDIGISDDEWAEVTGSSLQKDDEVLIKR